MLQPSPVGAPGDAAPQAKTFSEAMEVLGAGAYPTMCNEYNKYMNIFKNIKELQNEYLYEYSEFWVLQFVPGLMHRYHGQPCQASTGLLAKDVVWEPSPASAKTQWFTGKSSWHRVGKTLWNVDKKILMFARWNGEIPAVQSRKLSFLMPIHRQWRRPKKSWQILGQQLDSRLVCHVWV